MAPGRVAGDGIYSLERPTWALGSNRLKGWHTCNLGGSGEPTFEGGVDMWAQGVGQPLGGASRPHMSEIGIHFGDSPSGVF